MRTGGENVIGQKRLIPGAAGFGAALALALSAGLLGACGGGRAGSGGPQAGLGTNAAPVQLGGAATREESGGSSVLGELDAPLVKRAIDNYRISKKRAPGPYQLVGADLDGDGVHEALVLFQGKDWCTRTGCSMAVFKSFEHGFRPISRTVRVKPPVEIADASNSGYRDLLVQTGGGPAPERRVRLQFTGEGYSRNAMLQTEVPLGSVVRTEIAIRSLTSPPPMGPAGAATAQSSAPNR